MTVRRRCSFAIAMALAAGLTGCARDTIGRTPDDVLVVLTKYRIRDLDPRFALTSYDNKLSRLVAPGLTSVDRESMAPGLELAESLEQLDDTTWRAVVRADARFSTGAPVTAHDVAYTFSSTVDPDIGSLYRESWRLRIERVEVIDGRTAVFHLREPVATLPSDLDYGIISRDAALAGGGRFRGGQVVGAGAFSVVAHWGERVWLQRNPFYFGDPPPMRFVEVRTVRDANARMLLLVGGDADFAQNEVRLDLVSAVAEQPGLRVDSKPSAILTYLMLHNEDAALRDVRVRRAIALAIDRERIVRTKLHGRAVLATGLIAPIHWAYHGDVARWDYDPERAAKLLDEAGYPDRDGPGGEPRLRLVYKTSADAFRLAVARVIAAQLGEVGIEVEVRSFEFATFFEDIKRGNYQLGLMQTGDITEPDWYNAYFHSDSIPHAGNWGLHNRWRYRNARVDELIDAGRRTFDRAERKRIYAEVQTILADELPVIPLWHEDNVVVRADHVEGYQLLPSARFRGLQTTRKRAATQSR
jgi:peptide/nickel transport system substrate-binding protein